MLEKQINQQPPAIIEQQKQLSTWEDYVAMGIDARSHRDSVQFVLGDLANAVCEHKWGGDTKREHTIKQYAKDIGLNVKTLQEYARIARMFDKPNRIDLLSFRHHQLVSKLENPTEMLTKAADNNWTCEQLMLELKTIKDGQKPKTEDEEFKDMVDLSYDDDIQEGMAMICVNTKYKGSINVTYKSNIKQVLQQMKNFDSKQSEGKDEQA